MNLSFDECGADQARRVAVMHVVDDALARIISEKTPANREKCTVKRAKRHKTP